MANFDWDAWQAALLDVFRGGLKDLGRAHGAEPIYALALYGVYRERDGALYLPLLGAATQAGGPPADGGGFWSARFNPPDWDLEELPLGGQSEALEKALIAEATRATVSHWREVESAYFEVLVAIAKRLRDEAPSVLDVTDDFICFWHDAAGGPELAARTIPDALFKRLFARQVAEADELAAARAQPEHERARLLVTRFGCYEGITTEDAQRELLALGGVAVPAVVDALADPECGWTAAKVLGQIGVSTPEAIAALRERAEGHWCAKALGMLGDHAWLETQPPAVAVNGLCAPLQAITAGVAKPLDYRPLERFLDAADVETHALVDNALAPGSSYVEMRASDLDEAICGLGSDHAVVRWHAASLVGERALGSSVGKQVLPLLVQRLSDANPLVRRLAVLSIDRWKATKRHQATIEALRDDPDEVVARIAAAVLDRS